MKKITTLLSLLVLLVAAMSCENENVKKLKREVHSVDKHCPMNMGTMGDLVSLKYDEKDNEVRAYFVINDDLISLDVMKKNKEEALNALKLSLSREESLPMTKTMIDAGAGFLVTFKSKDSGKAFEFSITPEDMKKIYDSPLSEDEINRMLLETQIARENATYPILVDEGMELTKVEVDGDNVIYYYSIDENSYDLSLLKLNQDGVKRNMAEIFEEPTTNSQIKLMSSLGKGLVYHYYGPTSGNSVDITFTPDELETYIK